MGSLRPFPFPFHAGLFVLDRSHSLVTRSLLGECEDWHVLRRPTVAVLTMSSTRAHKYVFSIWYAARHGRKERVEELVEREGLGIVNAVDTTHGALTPLHWAAKFGHIDLVKWLLLRGANPSHVADNGSTPLHLAAGNSTLEMVRLLLEHAAEPRLLDQKGDTAADVAKTYRRFQSEDLIRRWVPCGGFPDMRNSGFEFQRVDELSLRFTLPPPEEPPKPKRTLEWMTPTEAATEEERRKVRRELAAQMESLHLKEHGLGEHVPTVGTSLLRIGRLLRKLGPMRKAECLEALHRSASIFETHYRQARLALRPANPDDNSAELEDRDAHGGSTRPSVSTGVQPSRHGKDPALAPLPPPKFLSAAEQLAAQRADEYATILKELSSVYIASNDFKTAEKYARSAVRTLSIEQGEDNEDVELASALTNLALLLRKNRTRKDVTLSRLPASKLTDQEMERLKEENATIESETKEIDALLLRALKIVEGLFTPNHLDVAEILIHIGRGHVLRSEWNKAAVLFERALGIIGDKKPSSELHAKTFDELGESYYKLKRFDISEQLFQRALDIREKLLKSKESALPAAPAPSKEEEEDDESDESLTKIMRAEAGTDTGMQRILSEAERTQVPFSKGFIRRKPEDYEYEEVSLVHPEVQRSFNNLAIVSNAKIKSERKARHVRRANERAYKAKVDRVRRVDDKRYLEERPNREKEGVYSGQVGMKNFISEILDQPDIGDRATVGRGGTAGTTARRMKK